MNRTNYANLDEAYSQINLINENNINIKKNDVNKKNVNKNNWFTKIGNFFRFLCCCCSNNKIDDTNDDDGKNIIEINLTQIIEPYLGQFINNCWQGVRTKDFYKNYEFVPKNDNEKIVYIYDKKDTENIQDTDNSKLIVNKLENEDLLDYEKIRENSDKEVQQKYNIKTIKDATNIFAKYMNNRDNEMFIGYIFEMDRKNYKIVKKNIENKNIENKNIENKNIENKNID